MKPETTLFLFPDLLFVLPYITCQVLFLVMFLVCYLFKICMQEMQYADNCIIRYSVVSRDIQHSYLVHVIERVCVRQSESALIGVYR